MNKTVKSFLIGAVLAIAVVIIHLLCTTFLYLPLGDYYTTDTYYTADCSTAIIFAVTMVLFLTSSKLRYLFIKGFTGLFLMFAIEIFKICFNLLPHAFSLDYWFEAYVAGFFGSLAGVALAIIMTLAKIKLFKNKEKIKMEKSLKIKLIIYAAVSAIGFSYLILPQNAGISVLIYAVLQGICLWFCVPDRKRLWLFLPVIILALNSFISGNTIWKIPNFFVAILLYSLMFINFSIKDTTLNFLKETAVGIAAPLQTIHIPFIWASDINREKAPIIKRVLAAVIITVPCAAILIFLLSSADMVFSKGASDACEYIFELINPSAIFKIILGIFVGLYLFGMVYSAYYKKISEYPQRKNYNGDLIIINIFMFSILIIYTIFVIIQFKYLFAGGTLPAGLTYTQYARKGFFELLALSCVNIIIILTVIKLTRDKLGNWFKISKILCSYLCAVTLVLLASSFYRMWLYNAADGLTRLRFMVFGFLIFEALGLLITFGYIIKPKFNITAVYLAIAVFYYSLLNIVPMDYFIAQNQINKYLNGERGDLSYVFTLSSDAAEPISRLPDNMAEDYFNNLAIENYKLPSRWQRYNLSKSKALKIYESYNKM